MTFLTAVDGCAYCGKPSDALITYSDGTSICLACRKREEERYAAATGGDCTRCVYNLAWHVDGQCPTEDDARQRSGAQ